MVVYPSLISLVVSVDVKHHVYLLGGSGSGATRLSTYACAHVSSVMEPKSHSSPLHTEESLEKVHPATNFTNQSLVASLVK